MHRAHLHRHGIASALAIGVLVLTATLQSRTSAATDCEGKPYGYPGCPIFEQQSSSSVPPHCGDGEIQEDEGEQCDDAHNNGVNTCSDACTILFCGDGIVSRQSEECEPQWENVYVTDPDTGDLVVEKRFATNSCGRYCEPPVYGADGSVSGGCTWKFDSVCSSSSSAQSVSAPVSSASSVSTGTSTSFPAAPESSASSVSSVVIAPRCGDGIQQAGEQCDDGNTVNTDLCTSSCQSPVCGNSLMQTGEQCDDGNTTDGDGCTARCTRETCGDGALQTGEQCDDGNRINTDACSNSCVRAYCGDRILQAGEECDDGNTVDDDRCSNACLLPRCGDGVREGLEECDDGNPSNADTCTNSCLIPRCGNGVTEGAEQCDDGRDNSSAIPDACRMNCLLPVCGDGVVDSGEDCDGSEDCSQLCKKVTSAPAASLTNTGDNGSNQMQVIVQGIVGAGIILLSILGYLLRERIMALIRGRSAVRDIDDIPLDEIEVPWHKW